MAFFYEKEAAIFRARSSIRGAPVEDIWHPGEGRWIPYEGSDRIKPVVFGNRISEAELPAEAQTGPSVARRPRPCPSVPTEAAIEPSCS